jgi:hypothetical protein
MTLWQRFQVWRLRPGIRFAARLAAQQASRTQNSWALGPEQNLMRFSNSLHVRLDNALVGDVSGLYLDAVKPVRANGEIVKTETK